MSDAESLPDPDLGSVEVIPPPELVAVRQAYFIPFPVEILPEPLRGFVVLSARAIHCDPVFIIQPLFASLASAIGNTRRVQVKPGWIEPSTLWTASIGKSGTGKSPGHEIGVRPAREQDQEANRTIDSQREAFESTKAIYEREMVHWRRKKGADPPPSKPNPPPESRHVVNDVTIEALAARLADSPRGLLLERDELSGWFGSFGQYKSGGPLGDESQWLQAYGAASLRVDRKGKGGSLYVPRANVSITGGIQPSILARCLTQERYSSGMAARFLFAMPPDTPAMWSDESVPDDLREEVRTLFRHLYALVGGASPGTEEMLPIDIPLDAGARELFIEFHDAMKGELAELDDALRAAWSKLIGSAPRLALVLHLSMESTQFALPPDPPISHSTMAAAIRGTKWYCNEARRVYGTLRASASEQVQQDLLGLARRRKGRLTIREVMQSRPRQFQTAEAVREVFTAMQVAGFGRLERTKPGPSGGRPSEVFTVLEGSDKTDNTPTPGGSVGFVPRGDGPADGEAP